MTAPIASGWSESPGGSCTHCKAPPLHGARRFRPFAAPRSNRGSRPEAILRVLQRDGSSLTPKQSLACARRLYWRSADIRPASARPIRRRKIRDASVSRNRATTRLRPGIYDFPARVTGQRVGLGWGRPDVTAICGRIEWSRRSRSAQLSTSLTVGRPRAAPLLWAANQVSKSSTILARKSPPPTPVPMLAMSALTKLGSRRSGMTKTLPSSMRSPASSRPQTREPF